MDGLHPALELLPGNNDNAPAASPRNMKQRAAVARLIQVSGDSLTEIGVDHGARLELFRKSLLA